MTLNELKIGQSAIIKSVGGDKGQLRQHLLDMGLIPGTEVTLIKFAPMGDPMELLIRGYDLTLRIDDARLIEVEIVEAKKAEEVDIKQSQASDRKKVIEHPGLGEGGKYHVKEHENPLPDSEILTFGLLGNQNCGKTTLFNQVTGANQHVGNFPGVTVDRKSGALRDVENTEITDLPGIYSLSP